MGTFPVTGSTIASQRQWQLIVDQQRRAAIKIAGGSGFVLDAGALRYGREQIVETYYRIELVKHVQFSPSLQYLRNPGTNRDRGSVKFVSFRLHLEYWRWPTLA